MNNCDNLIKIAGFVLTLLIFFIHLSHFNMSLYVEKMIVQMKDTPMDTCQLTLESVINVIGSSAETLLDDQTPYKLIKGMIYTVKLCQ